MSDPAQKKGRVAVFAGIGRLGVPAARRLLEKGWRIALSFRSGRGSERAVRQLREGFGKERVITVEADLGNMEDARRLVGCCVEQLGRINALINIASEYPGESDSWQRWQKGTRVQPGDWKFYTTNFMVARNPVAALLEVRDELNRDICIINFTDARSLLYLDDTLLDPYESHGGLMDASLQTVQEAGLDRLEKYAPPRHVNPYTLAKVDLVYLTRRLALDLGPDIRVNAIAPGPMLAPPDRSKDEIASVVEHTALKAWGGYTPIIQAVEYLLDNAFVTGEVLKVDGGMYLWARYHTK